MICVADVEQSGMLLGKGICESPLKCKGKIR